MPLAQVTPQAGDTLKSRALNPGAFYLFPPGYFFEDVWRNPRYRVPSSFLNLFLFFYISCTVSKIYSCFLFPQPYYRNLRHTFLSMLASPTQKCRGLCRPRSRRRTNLLALRLQRPQAAKERRKANGKRERLVRILLNDIDNQCHLIINRRFLRKRTRPKRYGIICEVTKPWI